MSGITDFEALRRALAENSERPEGPARNARAEELLTEAEKLDIPLAVIEALGHQVRVYNYSSEKDRVFVPFARLLRMWDERPEDFDGYEAHALHWTFKWMTAGMLGRPHVPLASVENWLGEMERRYRVAGYSERAVRAAEFSIASHIGDRARAERAYTAWLAADRDDMADCHACELHGQGGWQVESGRDAEGLELWRPVVEGEFACAHEPHGVLARSLAPLLRLGRVEEARARHLRGLRLVRPMESMRDAYADHVEFCALTGNEARGLELLAERPAYFTDTGHPRSLLEFLAVVALLMDRLTRLGQGARQVPGPTGRTWTARELAAYARTEALELAARFDERNGTSYIGDRTRARMAAEPLVERLPLGVRTAPAPPPVAEEGPEESGVPELLARARRLSETLQPDAPQAWAALARAADGAGLDARARAELADNEAMSLGPDGIPVFEEAAALYAEADDPGEALAARARGAYVRALTGETDAALKTVDALYDEVLALYAEEATGPRQTAGVLISRARVLMRRAHEGAPAEEAERAAREVLAFVGGRTGDDVRLVARGAEARAMLAELAELGGDLSRAADLFRRAAAEYTGAGLPWFAVEYEARVGALSQHLGEPAEAERALRSALEHGGAYLEPAGRAQLHLQLAELIGARGGTEEAAGHALQAAHWADEAGESGTFGAWARHLLGGLLLRQGRWTEAAEVLESALAELSAEVHGDGALVQTRWWLGDCLSELGEHRAAAEHRLLAAGIAEHWPEQQDHATLAHLAGESLAEAELPAEADRAYVRAGELWEALGNPYFTVRALRARAWLAPRLEAGAPGARALMARAVEVCGEALAEADDPLERARLTTELAHTHRQFGELLATVAKEPGGEAVAEMERSAALFATLGADGLHGRTGAELAAAALESGLGRTAEARARARAVLAAYEGADDSDDTVRVRREAAARLLDEDGNGDGDG
ncbi:tetratricopeptide repeat protein [Streptomyces sp. NPDC085596]|uniref:tetratricopeptide repeat protein n=1 Tax=Streptomyces sp. NPDC085596 TaxID=3365731 RepID=UPI0037D0F717